MEADESRKTKQLLKELKSVNQSSKLDWIYSKKSNDEESEDFLLGKRVDKAFERSHNAPIESRVGVSELPESTLKRTSNVPEQLDNRKVGEDPLLLIKKKEEAARLALLNHPMMIKQLQKQKDEQMKKGKAGSVRQNNDNDLDKKLSKKLAKLKKHSPEFLDELLQTKLKKMKGINLKELLEEDSESSESDSQFSMRLTSKSLRKRESSEEPENRKRAKHYEGRDSRKRDYQGSGSRGHNDRHRSDSPDRSPPRKGGLDTLGKSVPKKRLQEKVPEKRKEPQRGARVQLTAEEMERRRKEMEQNAKQRDEERTKNVERYRAEASKEEQEQRKEKDPDFLKKELVKAAGISTIEGRIKANVAKIQRGSTDMEKNFARR